MRTQLLRNILRPLARLIPDNLALPVVTGPLKGLRWISGAAPGRGKGLSVCWNRTEREQIAAAEALAPRGGLCFDVGANVGLYTLLLARHAAQVVAFEPAPRNLRHLWAHVQRNGLDNVQVIPAAASDSQSMTGFETGRDPGRGHLSDSAGQIVTTVRLDDVAARLGRMPDLIKIDVEGAEAAVLRGAIDILRHRRPTLLLSTHGPKVRRQCMDLLTVLGYEPATPLNGDTPEEASEFVMFSRPGSPCIAGRAA